MPDTRKCSLPTHHRPVIMLSSAKDVAIEGGKFLDVARDYVHHEHHYQNPEFVWSVNIYPSAEASRLRCSESVFDGDYPEYLRDEAEIAVLKFLGYEVADVNDPRIKLQRRIQELQKKRGAKAFPLNSYTSSDFARYEELYRNPPYTNWGSAPNPNPNSHLNDLDFEEPHTAVPPPPSLPPSEYWHTYDAWYAWHTHCVASWQASLAAWTTALMSWSPPWLGMCAPSWPGAWASWQ